MIGVLQIGPVPPPHGGVASNLLAIRRHLADKNIPTGTISLSHGEPSADTWCPKNPLATARLLLALPYRILHLHVGGDLTKRLLGLCLLMSVMPRRRVVLTIHSGGLPTSAMGLRARRSSFVGWVLRRLDAVIAVSEEIGATLSRFGVDRLHVIPPYSLPKEIPSGALPVGISSFFASHRHVIIAVGGLETEYDIDRQLEAFADLGDDARFGLLLIGSGSQERRLRGAMANSPLGRRVHFAGDVPHATTLRAISQSAVMWRTTLFDGDSISIREALHLGVPVIATGVVARPEGTIVIPPRDTAALVEATLSALTAPPAERRLQSGDDNMARVAALYARL